MILEYTTVNPSSTERSQISLPGLPQIPHRLGLESVGKIEANQNEAIT